MTCYSLVKIAQDHRDWDRGLLCCQASPMGTFKSTSKKFRIELVTHPAHKADFRRKQKWLLVPHECLTKRLFFNHSAVAVFVSFGPLEMLWAIHVSQLLWLALLVPSNPRSILRTSYSPAFYLLSIFSSQFESWMFLALALAWILSLVTDLCSDFLFPITSPLQSPSCPNRLSVCGDCGSAVITEHDSMGIRGKPNPEQ